MTWRELLETLKEMDESFLDTAALIQVSVGPETVWDKAGELLMAARIQEPTDGYNDHYLVVR